MVAGIHHVEFPEAVIVNRAMIDAVIGLLIDQGVIDLENVRKRFEASIKDSVVEAQAGHSRATEQVATQ